MCTKFIHPTDVIQIMCTLCLQKVYKYTSILIKETILYYTKVLVQCVLLLVERACSIRFNAMSYCSFVSAEMARIAYRGSFCYKKRILPVFRGKKTFFQPPFHLTSATQVLVVYNYRTIVVYKKSE